MVLAMFTHVDQCYSHPSTHQKERCPELLRHTTNALDLQRGQEHENNACSGTIRSVVTVHAPKAASIYTGDGHASACFDSGLSPFGPCWLRISEDDQAMTRRRQRKDHVLGPVWLEQMSLLPSLGPMGPSSCSSPMHHDHRVLSCTATAEQPPCVGKVHSLLRKRFRHGTYKAARPLRACGKEPELYASYNTDSTHQKTPQGEGTPRRHQPGLHLITRQAGTYSGEHLQKDDHQGARCNRRRTPASSNPVAS